MVVVSGYKGFPTGQTKIYLGDFERYYIKRIMLFVQSSQLAATEYINIYLTSDGATYNFDNAHTLFRWNYHCHTQVGVVDCTKYFECNIRIPGDYLEIYVSNGAALNVLVGYRIEIDDEE